MKKTEKINKNMMKHINKNGLSKHDDIEISKKIIDLCMLHQIESSYTLIKLYENEIKRYELQKNSLLNGCLFWFQKKKVEKELEKIDDKICKLYDKISEEISLVSKIEKTFSEEIKLCNTSNELISYYDLLSLLKIGIIYKKVVLHKFNEKITFVYDGCNYVIENEENISDRFEEYLCDCDADNSKFEKNIQLIDDSDELYD